MLLLKPTDAWSELNELDDRNLLEDRSLIQSICDTCNTEALDEVVSNDFPNGCDIVELAEYFNTEGEHIADELGISYQYGKLRIELGEEDERVYEVGDKCLAFAEHDVIVTKVEKGEDGFHKYEVKSLTNDDEWVGVDWYELRPIDEVDF